LATRGEAGPTATEDARLAHLFLHPLGAHAERLAQALVAARVEVAPEGVGVAVLVQALGDDAGGVGDGHDRWSDPSSAPANRPTDRRTRLRVPWGGTRS